MPILRKSIFQSFLSSKETTAPKDDKNSPAPGTNATSKVFTPRNAVAWSIGSEGDWSTVQEKQFLVDDTYGRRIEVREGYNGEGQRLWRPERVITDETKWEAWDEEIKSIDREAERERSEQALTARLRYLERQLQEKEEEFNRYATSRAFVAGDYVRLRLSSSASMFTSRDIPSAFPRDIPSVFPKESPQKTTPRVQLNTKRQISLSDDDEQEEKQGLDLMKLETDLLERLKDIRDRASVGDMKREDVEFLLAVTIKLLEDRGIL
jgi:hypothetical protein